MHPLLGRVTGLAAYLGLCMAVGLASAVRLALRGALAWDVALVAAVPLSLVYGVVCLAAWYVCLAFPVSGAGTAWRAMGAQALAAAFTSTVWVAVARVWATTAAGVTAWSRDATLLLFAAGFLLFLLSAAVHYAFIAIEAQEAARRLALESAVLAREAELRALRAQVNPHFLFNSLHSIGSLAGSRPAAARDMAIALGEFLRHSLRLGGLAGVPLQHEIDLMAQYLSIEQVRFGERLSVRIDVGDDAGGARVPPLLLQPLVENAIKHGVAGLLEGGHVAIDARIDGGRCHVTVANAFDPEAQARAGTGTGLRNVRDRLSAHYGSASSFDARAEGDRFVVRLVFPVDAQPEGTQR